MQKSQAMTHHNFAIRQGAMSRYCSERTGSTIVEEKSASYQDALQLWGLLTPAAPHAQEGRSAPSGCCFVLVKNHADSPAVPALLSFNVEPALPSVALSPASVVEAVRNAFGLNISEAADVFGITRQTAYQWMKLADMDQVRSQENRDRIKQLFRAAQTWQNQPSLKGRWLRAILPSGNSVLDLLKSPQIDFDVLHSAYQALAASTANRRREEGERATKAVTSLAGAFAGLGAGRKAQKETR